jgi:hypothetical protein
LRLLLGTEETLKLECPVLDLLCELSLRGDQLLASIGSSGELLRTSPTSLLTSKASISSAGNGRTIDRIKEMLEEYTELEVNEAMSVTVQFKDTFTNKITSLEYQIGAVIPISGDHIVSPFNADRTALVSEVTGDGKKSSFSVFCAE